MIFTPQKIQEISAEIHNQLYFATSENDRKDKQTLREKIYILLKQYSLLIPIKIQNEIVVEIINKIFEFGPITNLLNDDELTEIMVNDYKSIFVERNGVIEQTNIQFDSNASLLNLITKIADNVGKRIDESSPFVDARLKDGSRVNAIIEPLSLNGPSLTIRKFPKKTLTINDLLEKKSLNEEIANYLKRIVIQKKNIIISGGTGSGKTSLLNLCGSFIPENERIITIEDSAELRLPLKHVVRLESKPANIEGKGEITIRTLLKNALRMRPDRIIVGEIRSDETIDMLQAMNTGHDGSLTTVHANSTLEAVYRIETMCLMSKIEIPLSAIRQQITTSIHIIIQQKRLANGKRKISQISELIGLNQSGHYIIKDIFKYNENNDEFEKL